MTFVIRLLFRVEDGIVLALAGCAFPLPLAAGALKSLWYAIPGFVCCRAVAAQCLRHFWAFLFLPSPSKLDPD